MWEVGEVAELTVKNSTPWNNIWILHRSQMFSCVFTRKERSKSSVEMLRLIYISGDFHTGSPDNPTSTWDWSFCVPRRLAKLCHHKRRSQMLLNPQLTMPADFQNGEPLNIFDWCSAVMQAAAQRPKVSAKGWGTFTSLWLHRRHSPVHSGPRPTNVDIWKGNMGKKEHQRAHNVSESQISN